MGRSQQLVRPAARPARGHGLQALTTRPRGACPLTGRDRDVGRTNPTEKMSEGGERAESQPILRTVCFSERPVRSSTGHNFSSHGPRSAPRQLRRGAGAQSSTPGFRLPSGSSHLRASAQSKQMHVQLPFTMTGARKITGFDVPHLRHVIGGRIAGPLMLLPLSFALRLLGQNRLPSAPRTPREKSPVCLL